VSQPTASDADWTAYLDGGEHSSYNAAATAITPADEPSLQLAWRWVPPASPNAGPSQFLASPTVSDGVVYIGSSDGYLYAVDEATQATLWSDFLGLVFATPSCGGAAQGFTSTATVAPNPATGQMTVYDNAGNGWLYAIDAATGAVEWKALVDVPGRAVNDYYSWGSPLVANGRVYVGISSDCDEPLVPAGLVSFNQSTGGQLAWWDSLPAGEIGASVWSSPAVAPNGDIFTDTGNGPGNVQNFWAESILRLDPDTLQLLDGWQVPLSERIGDGDFGSSPTMFTADIKGTETPMVGACNKNGLFYAFAQDDLSAGPVWSDQFIENSTYGNECDAAPTWNGTDLIEGGGGLATINGTKYPGSVRALDPATGAVLWQTGMVGPVIGSTAEDGGGVVTASTWGAEKSLNGSERSQTGVYLLNAATGAILGLIQTGAQQFGQGVFAGDELIAAAQLKPPFGLSAYKVPGT
jgi:outer membrane protein assembly factor BamB